MKRRPLLVAGALALQACAISPAPHGAKQIEAPLLWRAGKLSGAAAPLDSAWWRAFGDPMLDHYVETAAAHNVDLAIAETRVREAEANVRAAHSALFPTLSATLGGSDARDLNAFGAPAEAWAGQTGLQIAYEVDLWGRVRALDRAGLQSLQANRAGRDAARLAISAATARTYIGLLSLDAQLHIARETLASRTGALRIARRRAKTGYTSDLEAAQALAEYESAAQRVPALELAARRQENALRILIGETMSDVSRGSFADLTLPTISAGLPSQLLARRPDIVQAEATLAAADSHLAAARAAFLPQVRLNAAFGKLFVEGLDPVNIWSIGGSALAPILDGGRLAAQAGGAEARRDQAAFAYQGIVLNAFAEVENALEGVSHLAQQRSALARQRDATARALQVATNRYQTGYASYLEQLDAQRGLLAAELGHVQAREAELSNALSLYLALGGGWQSDLAASPPEGLARR